MNKSTLYTLLYFILFLCVQSLGRNGSIFSTLNNKIGNFFTGKSYYQNVNEPPHIALKIKPSTTLHLTRNELNMLLLEIKHEVTRQMEQLQDELADKGREDERHMSTWTLNHAPVYIPYAKTIQPHSGDNLKNNHLKHDIKDYKHDVSHEGEKNKIEESKLEA